MTAAIIGTSAFIVGTALGWFVRPRLSFHILKTEEPVSSVKDNIFTNTTVLTQSIPEDAPPAVRLAMTALAKGYLINQRERFEGDGS